MRNIRKILVGMLIIALLTGTAFGYDASSPYSVTMNFYVPSDTSFTVGLALAETTIDFNPAGLNSKCVEPDSQTNSTGVAIANITNAGNVNANYSINLTAAKPSWVDIKASATSGATLCSASTSFGTTTGVLTFAGWNNTAPSGIASVFLIANFTSATGGTTQRTFQINANQS